MRREASLLESDDDVITEAVMLLQSIGGIENKLTEETLRRVLFERHHFGSLAEEETFYFRNIGGALACVAFVALIAGLFLGLLTLDALDLQIIQRASIDEDERVYATVLLPIVKERHRLLVTLLILNALAYEAMPIFLDALMPSWVAILFSTTIILLFGEILPSGIFTGPNQLYLGYKMVPIVRFFLWIMWPFAMPMTLLLDYLVRAKDGEAHPETYNRGELSALVRIQYEERIAKRASKVIQTERKKAKNTSHWTALKGEILERVNELQTPAHASDEEAPAVEHLIPPLHATEVDMVEGSLQMKTRLAMDVYTPLSHVYAIPDNLVLDKATISRIYGEGYSRVPVYHPKGSDPNDRTAVVGFLMTRQLMLIDWEHCREVSSLPLQIPDCVSPRINLVDLLRILRSGGSLMAFVCTRPDLANKALRAEKPLPPEAGFIGVVCLEDIMESILGDRIYDESDIRDRDRAIATLTRWAASTLQSFLRKRARRRKDRNRTSQDKNLSGRMTSDESAPLLPNGSEAERSYAT